MSYMVTGDPGTSPFSPYFKGVKCVSCGSLTYEPDEEGNCENCHKVKCPACLEPVIETHLQPFAGRKICPDCLEYESAYSY